MPNENSPPQLQRIIRWDELPKFIGLKRTSVQRLMARGQFPKPIKLMQSGYAVGWLEEDLAAWQQKQIAKHRELEQQRAARKRA
jgi:predicted DNA-binding transcriptional regulator AlpA